MTPSHGNAAKGARRRDPEQAHTWALPRLEWRETWRRIRADHTRLMTLAAPLEALTSSSACFHPSFVCVFLYRMANHLFRGGFRLPARAIWQLNMFLTGADINPASDLGEGLVILNPAGTTIIGSAGRNLTVMSCAGCGGELGRREDIGGGPGLCVIGDDVVIEPHSGVLGPVRVGDRVRISAGITVSNDVPADTLVVGPDPRCIRRRD